MKVCEDGMMKREERLCRSEKIPEGSVVRQLLLRVKVKGGEEREEWMK